MRGRKEGVLDDWRTTHGKKEGEKGFFLEIISFLFCHKHRRRNCFSLPLFGLLLLLRGSGEVKRQFLLCFFSWSHGNSPPTSLFFFLFPLPFLLCSFFFFFSCESETLSKKRKKSIAQKRGRGNKKHEDDVNSFSPDAVLKPQKRLLEISI